MPVVFTQSDIETLASGKTVPPAVFDAIIGDREAVRHLVRLLRVAELFSGGSAVEGEEETRNTPAGEVPTVDLPGTRREIPSGLPSLAGFVFFDKLGEGAFGQVWKAFDANLERACAVKVVSGDGLSEARVLASLPTHRNRAQVFALHQDERGACLVLEYVEGPNLSELRCEKAIEWQTAAKYVAQVAEGLREVHARGLIHRDIKPGNIVFDAKRGEAVLVDFGLASRAGEGGGGTPVYMAPEAWVGEATAKSDVFSLGMTLSTLLAGKGELPADLPRAVRELLAASLEPHEEKRIDLEAFLTRARGLEAKVLADRFAELAKDRGPTKLRVIVSTSSGAGPERFVPSPVEAARSEGVVTKVKTGDLVRLEAKADRDGYYTLLCFGSGGELSVAYNGGQQGKVTRANEVEQWTFRAEPPTGTDTFGVVWTMHAWAYGEAEWRRMLGGEALLKRAPTRGMALVGARTLREDETWAGAVVAVVQGGG